MAFAPSRFWARSPAIIVGAMLFDFWRGRQFSLLPTTLILAACTQQPFADEEPHRAAGPQDATTKPPREQPLPSPDTTSAIWTVAPSGKAIRFGNAGDQPWLTLDCRLSDSAPPQFAVIRHAGGMPGQTALFAVMGNGHVSRLPASAVLHRDESGGEGEWRWETSLPAADQAWNLFVGEGDMRATLPGKGAIEIPPSPIPGEFVTWCRNGGRVSAPAELPSGPVR